MSAVPESGMEILARALASGKVHLPSRVDDQEEAAPPTPTRGQSLTPNAKRYDPTVYNAERDIEVFRSHNGSAELRKLKPRHKQIIALHLQGKTSTEIASQLGLDAGWVGTVLRSDLSRKVLERVDAVQELEFQRLRARADDVVRSALFCDSRNMQLKAAEMYYRREEKLADRGGSAGLTAEDVAKKLLEGLNIRGENVQVNLNIGGQTFTKDLGDGESHD